jgi:NADH-quinone oxidoreductase subunit M
MNFFLQPLTLLTFFPLLGMLVLFFIPNTAKNALRWTALLTSLVIFALSLWVLRMFNP